MTGAALTIDSLVAEHYRFVWRVLRGFGLSPADADDAAQRVFMTAARKLSRIDPPRARSFVYGVALREANNARRGLRRRREVSSELEHDDAEPESQGPEKRAALRQGRELLQELLQQLPPPLRRVLILAELEQLAVPEIASLEQVPVGTAASRLRLARQRFREFLDAARERNPFAVEP